MTKKVCVSDLIKQKSLKPKPYQKFEGKEKNKIFIWILVCVKQK